VCGVQLCWQSRDRWSWRTDIVIHRERHYRQIIFPSMDKAKWLQSSFVNQNDLFYLLFCSSIIQ
jgi:hypothetical protein